MKGFTEDQIRRYSRHIVLPQIGGKGQHRLLQSRVLVVGAGGLGSPVCYYLVAAGVGVVGIADMDQVGLSNLQRQILHSTEDLDKPKVDSAREKLERLNPDVEVLTYREPVTHDNAMGLIRGYDVVIDCVDNFAARYLLNDACVLTGKPLIEAGVLRFDGLAMTIIPGEGPCYRCIFPKPPTGSDAPSCAEAGILGATAGILGTIQAAEAIKVLLGVGRTLSGRLLAVDVLAMTFTELESGQDAGCPVCGEEPSIQEILEENYELADCDTVDW